MQVRLFVCLFVCFLLTYVSEIMKFIQTKTVCLKLHVGKFPYPSSTVRNTKNYRIIIFIYIFFLSLGDSTAWVLPFTSGGFIYIALVTIVPDLLKETRPK